MKTFFVVMAGGPGSRLWPESRRAFPKPFLPLLPDGRSLFRATLDRVKAISEDGVIVVTGRPFEEHVHAAAPEIAPERILLEPEGRDTAPCVAWAALEALRADEDAALVVMPSDHQIYPDEKFQTRIQAALRLVEENPAALVTLGVTPTSPSTAYGYIEKGAAVGPTGLGAYRVATFHEKPDVETAETYLRSGNFLWNAGVFVWKARTFLNLLVEYEPDFKAPLEKARERINAARAENRNPSDDPAFIRAFREMKRISVDKAVLERAKEILTLQVDFFWNDLGS
ncbi:MAG: mannose-1-phosphate guanylyltransferase, partial [Thermoguttaceae bacterium]|nr:mannose-1-phosphate guanylyltransferase [Thermoguttaceae bacterium]